MTSIDYQDVVVMLLQNSAVLKAKFLDLIEDLDPAAAMARHIVQNNDSNSALLLLQYMVQDSLNESIVRRLNGLLADTNLSLRVSLANAPDVLQRVVEEIQERDNAVLEQLLDIIN